MLRGVLVGDLTGLAGLVILGVFWGALTQSDWQDCGIRETDVMEH